jgi:WD40 repeat protein
MRILQGHKTNRPVYDLAFSPDGERLASCAGDDTVRLWDLAGGTSQALHAARSHFVAFSPGGDRLVCANGARIWVTELATRAVVSIREGQLGYSMRALFSRDGQTLLVVNQGIHLCDPASGEARSIWSDSSHLMGCLALDATGTLGATAHWERRPKGVSGRFSNYSVRLWRYPTGEVVRRFDDITNDVGSLALSPDGRWLAAVCESILWVWETATGAVVLRQRLGNRHFKCVAFSPDGRTLAAAHTDATVRLYAVPGWVERETFDWGIGPLISVCFAPDGMRAAAGSKRGRIVVWDVDP